MATETETKKQSKQWTLLDLISLVMILSVFLLVVLVFTPMGDSLAAAGRQSIALYTDPVALAGGKAQLLLSIAEKGKPYLQACPEELVDHLPCEDPRRMIRFAKERNHYRERHCPPLDEKLLCLIPTPRDYRVPVSWPESLNKVWYSNMPHSKIAERKGHQGWMREQGSYFVFPGGGTMFTEGAAKYIEKLQKYIPFDGTIRTALDVGCGVASFGGYLLEKDILTMSFAPRDSHKAQIQFALERGIPAFVAMLGTRRLPFPASSFDMVHCSRCLISFTAYNGSYLLEMDRLLRPGGYFVLSGPPVQWSKMERDWEDLKKSFEILLYETITVDDHTAIWRKPLNSSILLEKSGSSNLLCSRVDDPNAAWYTPLKECVSRQKGKGSVDGGLVVPKWPERLSKAPSRISEVQVGGDGATVFEVDTRRWRRRVKHYREVLGFFNDFAHTRNVLDMNSVYGGFAAALISDPVWVMNVVPASVPNTLPIIYDRGLIGVSHDWCEAFSTYPRTFDVIHAANLESIIWDKLRDKHRCSLVEVLIELDRLLRPEGRVIIRDSTRILEEVARIATAIHWTVNMFETEAESIGHEKLLVAKKPFRLGLKSSR